jgi:hypothetical protein
MGTARLGRGFLIGPGLAFQGGLRVKTALILAVSLPTTVDSADRTVLIDKKAS